MQSSGQFRATFFWKEMLQFVFSHTTFHSQRKKKKCFNHCLLGNEVIDVIHIFLRRKNGNFINADDLSRAHAVKVFKKMIEMNILKAETSQKCDETRFYSVSEVYGNVKSCSNIRDHCLNPRLPSCVVELPSLHKNIQDDDADSAKLEKYSTEDMLLIDTKTVVENQQVVSLLNHSTGSVQKKRRSFFTRDEQEVSLPKVKCIRRHSYNLANRHSEIYCRGHIPLFRTAPAECNTQVRALARVLYEFEMCYLEDIVIAMDCFGTNASSEYAFENKMFAEPEISLDHDEMFINAALKCVSIVPKDFNDAKTITDKKIICFHAARLFYEEKYVIPLQFNELVKNVVSCMFGKLRQRSTLSVLDISQIFINILPLNVRKELLSLLNFIRAGCQESYSFDKNQSNAKTFYGIFSLAVTHNASLTNHQIIQFTQHLVSNQSIISSYPSVFKLTVPRLTDHTDADSASKRSRSYTKNEIKSVINYIHESPIFSDSKTKHLVKKLKKEHHLL